MNRIVRRPRSTRLGIGLVLVLIMGAIGFSLGMVESRDLTRIILTPPNAAGESSGARLATTIVDRDGWVVYLTPDGYVRADLPPTAVADLFRAVEAAARGWDAEYMDAGSGTFLEVELVGLDRSIQIEHPDSDTVIPASLRSLLATARRWPQDLSTEAVPFTDAPLVMYLTPAPAVLADAAAYQMPADLDVIAAQQPDGITLGVEQARALAVELPAIGDFARTNLMVVSVPDVGRFLLSWAVAWDVV